MNSFIRELKQYRHNISKQTLNTLKGQALSGNVEAARKGLNTALNNKHSKSDKFTNAHRSTRYITRQYDDVDYQAQLRLSLKQ